MMAHHQPQLVVLIEPMVEEMLTTQRALHFENAAQGGDDNKTIWIMWKNQVEVENIMWHDQMVTCKVTVRGTTQSFTCSFVYAMCKRAERYSLWERIIEVADNMDEPWIVGGDFNVVAQADEKKGGKVINASAVADLITV